MVSLNVTEEQAAVLEAADAPVVLRGPRGNILGVASRGPVLESADDERAFQARMLERAKTLEQGVSTTQEVLERLHQGR